MGLAPWVRDRLWRADHWYAELAGLRGQARTSEQTFDLAVASEYCDPDRSVALGLYLDAWRAGHAAAGERARALAEVLRAHVTLAELANAGGDYLAAGAAYLDAGLPELAIAPLELAGAGPLLAAARGRVDAEREIAGGLATATPASLLHAERVARLARRDDLRAKVLHAATIAFPDDDRIARAAETRLFERNHADDLLAYYRDRFERAPSRAQYVERLRAAGVELLARNIQPGLGLRLVRMSLETAYAALLPEVTSHLAVWHLIWMHALEQRSTLELAPLIVQAFTAPLPEDDAVYLAYLGLQIAWRDAADPLAAQPYAATLLDFVPDHPLAVAFVEEIVPADAPPIDAPPLPVVTFAAKPAPATATKTTSRIPVLEEGPVKRVAGPAMPKPSGVTGRLALLTPRPREKPKSSPPPRASALRRDTSPIPMQRRPARPTAERAPRKVVPVDVVIELPSGAFFSTVLRDLSASGAFVVTRRAIEVGTVVALELRLPDPGKLTRTDRVNGRIARRTDVGWGLAFVDASPELLAAIRALTED